MRLLTSRLPSGGVGCTSEFVDVNPLTYKELSLYCSQKSSNELEDFIWDVESLVMTIPGWQSLSSFDTPVLIAYRKLFSINLTGNYKLGDLEFSLKDIDFTPLDRVPLSIESVTLGGVRYQPSIKPMEEFYRTLKIFEGKTSEIKFPVVASFLGIKEPSVILSFTTEDVAICEKLYRYLQSQPVVRKGGAEAILFGKASELFQHIVELCRITEDKIQFSETVQI